MLIISIDTSTKVCSLALHEAGKLLACQEFHIDKATSQVLTISIEQMLTNSQLTLADLSAVAIAKGPGSYTGLRMGAATAKGLCYALDKPLVAISTLEAMVEGVAPLNPSDKHFYCPMIDARRMEVFCGVYDQTGNTIVSVKAEIIDENSFTQLLVKNTVIFFGDGAAKCRPYLSQHPNAFFVEDIHPSARFMGKLAWQQWQNKNWENIETFEPFYLKEFVGNVRVSK